VKKKKEEGQKHGQKGLIVTPSSGTARLYKLRLWWLRDGHLSSSPRVVTSVRSIGDRAVGLGESG
jgi:hypothetical protein